MGKVVKGLAIAGGTLFAGAVLGGVLIWRHTQAQQLQFGALAEACRGGAVALAAALPEAPTEARAMGIIERGDELRQVFPYSVPDDAQAATLEQVALVACHEEPRAELLESCPYGRGDDGTTERVVERRRWRSEWRLVEARSGRVLARETLYGREPRACLPQESFLKAQYLRQLDGEPIGNARLQQRLRDHLAG